MSFKNHNEMLDGLLLSTLITDVVLIDEAKQLPTGFFATAHLG
jgi:hypothetical protein